MGPGNCRASTRARSGDRAGRGRSRGHSRPFGQIEPRGAPFGRFHGEFAGGAKIATSRLCHPAQAGRMARSGRFGRIGAGRSRSAQGQCPPVLDVSGGNRSAHAGFARRPTVAQILIGGCDETVVCATSGGRDEPTAKVGPTGIGTFDANAHVHPAAAVYRQSAD